MKRLLAAVLAFSPCLALAQTAPYCDPLIDPTALIASKRKAAANPLAEPHLRRALSRLKDYGIDQGGGFEVIRATTDDMGWQHVRLQQTAYGVKVKGGRAISHLSRDGIYSDTLHVVRGVLRQTPRLTSDDAIKAATNDARRVDPLVTAPTATLWYVPRYVNVLKTTGAPAPGPLADPEAEFAMPEEVGADDVTRTLTGVDLVWEVETTEGDCARRSYASKRWQVDALKGTVLSVRSLDHEATGTGFHVGSVTFNTKYDSGEGCYHMNDNSRKFTTEDEDRGTDDPVNCDSNNVWGNGLQFMGDAAATNTNRQTAMVDVHFGATVYWDLLSNVFQMQGPDDDFYSVNQFVHDGTLWNNAQYHGGSGNVSYGDGDGSPFDNRTFVDCAGHELGHAWNDFNVEFDGDTDCLNESLADIFGEWTDAYLSSGNFASGSSNVGSNSNIDFKNQCSGRSLVKPGIRYWYNGIQSAEEHKGAGPSNRAFAMLARGASSFMSASSHSFKLPWGMAGIGLHDAARIYFMAMQNYMDPDDGYQGLRPAMYDAAKQIFGTSSAQVKAVFNAYAGISIGTTASNYPTKPSTQAEAEPNNTKSAPQVVSTMLPPAGAPSPSPRKARVSGVAATSNDVYRIDVGALQSLRIAYTGRGNTGDVVTVSLGTASSDSQTEAVVGLNSVQLETSCPTSSGCVFFVTVKPVFSLNGAYRLDADVFTP